MQIGPSANTSRSFSQAPASGARRRRHRVVEGGRGSARWNSSTRWFTARGVIDDLVDGIQRSGRTSTDAYWSRLAPSAAAIGCVPWLTDDAVIRSLADLGSACIVLDKRDVGPRAQSLHRLARPLSSRYLDGFDTLVQPVVDGQVPIIGPGSGPADGGLVEPVELGPVRVAGWAKQSDGGRPRPLLHSKMLVLGVLTYYEDDEELAGDILPSRDQEEPLVTDAGADGPTSCLALKVTHVADKNSARMPQRPEPRLPDPGRGRETENDPCKPSTTQREDDPR